MNVDTHPYISLFTGAGGLDLAVRVALPNTRAVCYVENEITAARILAARIAEGSIDDAPIWSDVRTFPCELFRGRVAGIVGGFPCPDYSVAGRRKGIVGKHGQLWNAMREAIRMVDPGWVFLENVPGITNAHKINRWRCVGHDLFGRTIWSRYRIPAGIGFVLGDLAEMGFSVQWGCLPASAVGASHKRDRWFALAYRAERGCGEVWESSRGNGFVDGRGADVGNAAKPRREESRCAGERQLPAEGGGGMDNRSRQSGGGMGYAESAGLEIGRCLDGDAGEEREAVERTSDLLEHADEIGCGEGRRWPEVDGEETSRRNADLRHAPPESGSRLPIFAPGPGDPSFPGLLVRTPWLRPAISQAEVESHLCGVADGMANLAVRDRTDALRATGNGVVPLQAATMLTELIRRAGVEEEKGVKR